MREASAEGENAFSPTARVSLSTDALCQKKILAIQQAANKGAVVK